MGVAQVLPSATTKRINRRGRRGTQRRINQKSSSQEKQRRIKGESNWKSNLRVSHCLCVPLRPLRLISFRLRIQPNSDGKEAERLEAIVCAPRRESTAEDNQIGNLSQSVALPLRTSASSAVDFFRLRIQPNSDGKEAERLEAIVCAPLLMTAQQLSWNPVHPTRYYESVLHEKTLN